MATIVTTVECMFCKKTSQVEITDEEMAAIDAGTKMQYALPERSAEFRELLISGSHPDCWTNAFGSEEDDDSLLWELDSSIKDANE